MKLIKGKNDLATVNPELIIEWNYEKNGSLKPTDVTAKSNKIVWWKCKTNHEWENRIAHRSEGTGCPYCSGRRAIEGKTDLATVNPELAQEWNYEKNGNLKPTDVKVKSNKKVWWKCKANHEWEAWIVSRSKGDKCPYCSGRKAMEGEMDLSTVKPELAQEWNYEKNGSLKPSDVTLKSGKKVWWKCKANHEWKAVIANRSGGIGCPYCSGQRAIKGKTDLVTVNPNLSQEWNYEKNGSLKPTDVTAKSSKRVWWKCKENHEWMTTINHRSSGQGCPYCSGHRAIEGKTDLATVNPYLAQEWNYKKNGSLKPTDVKEKSSKKVWWKCKANHEWKAVIGDRSNGDRCPYCSGRRAIEGKTDLATVNPELVKEWNFKKNKKLKPTEVTVKSDKKVWWICEKGHEWRALIGSRTLGRGCPQCKKIWMCSDCFRKKRIRSW